MFAIANLSFVTPWLLAALLILPAIYFLLRVTPPAPRRTLFPPLRFLLDLKSKKETPARTPWWLLALRLLAAALIILALAEPIYNAAPASNSSGPLVLFVDNDWAAAPNWATRRSAMNQALSSAVRQGRPVYVLSTAEENKDAANVLDAGAAAKAVDEMTPRAWLPKREQALERLQAIRFQSKPQILWLSDGLDNGDGQPTAEALRKIGELTILADAPQKSPLALLPPENASDGFHVSVIRSDTGLARDGLATALDLRGQILASAPFRFDEGKNTATATLAMPLDLRNDTARVGVGGAESAGAMQLLDGSNKRQAVGLVSSGASENDQPLLSDLYYAERAIAPYADLRKGSIEQMLDGGISVLVLTDIGQFTQVQHNRLIQFVENGGVLVRFAGPRLAAHASEVPDDDLVPVKLRGGERLMGSALSWPEPQHLSPFAEDSPFRGLSTPDEVTISRQVLADPSIELASHVWARLNDGTPLVTGTARGKGSIVLFHVAASPGWSSLPLSGLYVDMLKRVVSLGEGVKGPVAQAVVGNFPPLQTLDGFGRLQKPPTEAQDIKGSDLVSATLVPSPQHPPGLYGREGSTVAFNAVARDTSLRSLAALGLSINPYTEDSAVELKWPLLLAALVLFAVDALLSLWLRGHAAFFADDWRGALRVILPVFLLYYQAPAQAAEDAAKIASSALDTKLAYVVTGTPDVDEMSRAGLYGLGLALKQRTAFEPTDPIGIDIENDDLSFYPLIYWPMTAGQKELSTAAAEKLDQFMRSGGTILFDTRDGELAELGLGTTPGEQTLRRLLGKLDVPPLQPITADHVLTKTFYILHDFSGRWNGGQVWVEALPPPDPQSGQQPARGGDGVSPLIIGGNDWASAWATDSVGRPLAAVVPGGERQREMAYRFGVNAVMYAMTGNYKTDLVHVPALLERLGQ